MIDFLRKKIKNIVLLFPTHIFSCQITLIIDNIMSDDEQRQHLKNIIILFIRRRTLYEAIPGLFNFFFSTRN